MNNQKELEDPMLAQRRERKGVSDPAEEKNVVRTEKKTRNLV